MKKLRKFKLQRRSSKERQTLKASVDSFGAAPNA
jgi:hypothetical protein